MTRTSTDCSVPAAEPPERPLLQHAQELHLRRRRHLGDLVEEQRAAMGELEAALPAIDRRPVNAPFSWPKISLSSSVSGIAAQLMATNWNRRARAELVDRLRDELLAGARLAPDEHRCRRRRRLLDGAVDAPDARAVADDATEAAVLAQLPPQHLDLAQCLLALEHLVEQDPKALRIDRLGQVVVGAHLHRLDRRLDTALRRQDDDAQVGELILQRAQQVEAAHARHDQVAQDDGRAEGRDAGNGFLAIGRAFGGKPPRLQELGQADARRAIVLGNEHALDADVSEVEMFGLANGQ